MNQMEIFKNPEFGSVRVIEENDKYLFCGVDVAKALGYTKPQNRYLPFSSMTRTEPNSGFLKISIWFIA